MTVKVTMEEIREILERIPEDEEFIIEVRFQEKSDGREVQT